jgi:glycosyltransferase involved in cell wall biosynthesis
MAIIYGQDFEKKRRFFVTILITILFGGFFALQFWTAYRVQFEASKELEKLEKLTAQGLSDQKIKEEAFSLAIKNAQARVFESTLMGNLSAAAGVAGTLAGFMFGLVQYFDIRKKEYSQAIAEVFSKLWEEIANDNPKIQARAIIGLSDFLSEHNQAYHEDTMSALALLGKIHNLELLDTKKENKKDIGSAGTIAETALRRALETAFKSHLPTFRKTSWQGIKCFRFRADSVSETESIDKLYLGQADFRDGNLIEANFSGLNLHKVRFNAACLIGANFKKADLNKAEMQYTDLTGANFQGAILEGANLLNAKILNTDLKNARLQGAKISLYSTDWRLAKNWRDADFGTDRFNTDIKNLLTDKYGPKADEKFKILMLLWEYPSRVTGGGWTAAYHFIQQMRRKGANIAVLVPWPPEYISPYVFGNEIEVYPVGNPTTHRSLATYSGYTSVYSSVKIEEIDRETDKKTEEKETEESEGESQYYASSRFELMTDFTNRALQEVYEKDIAFDVIHADDWLTFPAAQRICEVFKKPWIAHFHSTEYERRPEPVNLGVSRIEKDFSKKAHRILVPGTLTKKIVTEKYETEESKVFILPNCLSKSEVEEAGLGSEALGEFHTQTVVFSGRLQWQKGIDIFLKIAKDLSFIRPGTKFRVHGRGEHDYVGDAKEATVYKTVYSPDSPYQEVELSKENIQFKGFTRWEKRSSVFEGTSVCVVPSRFEPFGMIVLEAMCHGVPVVYTKDSGVAEVIKAGLAVDFSKHEEVVEAIRCLLDNMERWEEMVKQQSEEINSYYKRSYADDLKQHLRAVAHRYKYNPPSTPML